MLNIFTCFLIILSVLISPDVRGNEVSEKIVFLISPPRSMSAAFARMMQARGDFDVFHEPFHLPYCCKFAPEYGKLTFGLDAYATYEETMDTILEASRRKAVFVKDVSFDVEDFFMNCDKVLEDENIYFVLLVRDPHASIVSFYKKSEECPPLLNYLIGYEPFYNIFHKIKGKAYNRLTVVSAEDLAENPQATIERLCLFLKVPFIPKSLHWSTDFDYQKDWKENKSHEMMEKWHGEAMHSTGFEKLTEYDVDEGGNPTFIEIQNPEDKKKCWECYDYNMKFYEKLCGELAEN